MNDISWLSNRWRSSGILEGDTVLLHSNIVRTLALLKKNGFKPSVDTILKSFIACIGNGTLIIPTFNFDFTKNAKFDIRNTPSHMGSLTEIARTYPNSIRTGHPIYSFCIIGKHSEFFNGINNYSGYGSDSPFDILRKLDGKIAVLDLDENKSMTFFHHVEEMNSVDYRFSKKFKGKYIDKDGKETEQTYAVYVRDLKKNIETNLNRLGKKLWEENIYIGDMPNIATGLRVCRANRVYEYVNNLIVIGEALGNLYEIKKKY